MSGDQLERSVLERKERDELHAIAEAMGLKPGSRTKKSDIIDQILRATGVDPVPETPGTPETTEKPEVAAPVRRRGRPRAAAAETVLPLDGAPTNGSTPDDVPEKGQPGADERPDAGAGTQAVASADDSQGNERGPVSPPSDANAREPARPTEAPARPPEPPSPGSGNGPAGPAPGSQPARTFEGGEPGNRRNRRRRGRDRDRSGDPQGGEVQFQGEPVPVKGFLDLREEGFGFLRTIGYLPSPRDVYVSISQARRFALRKGDHLEGASRPATSNEKYPALLRIDTVSGLTPDEARNRPRFEDLTPLFPDERLKLEVPGEGTSVTTARIVDLLCPIGKGQRGLIVSPPKAGKTTIMKQIAHSIEANNPEVKLIVLLVDERPEEVTDMRRSVQGEVVASTFDRPAEEHTQVAELAIERAKRLVELGQDVVIILDGITRLARAYNLAAPPSGRILSGGVDSGALYPPKKFFGAARNIEEGGSLTILGTALIETGSRMDEVIFEEFKGTGNMELRLDRKLAERRLYPAIDVNASSTRHEELLFDRVALQQVWKLRRVLNALANDGNAAAGLELLTEKIRATRSNEEFLAEIAKGPNPQSPVG